MRILLAVLLVALPGVVDAQSSREGSSLPPIGLPLPEIGLPLPPIGLAPPAPTPTTSPRPSPRREHRGERPRSGPRPGVVYVIPAYGYGPGIITPEPSPAPPAVPAVATTGSLILDLPRHGAAQVFVDGAFVGGVADAGSQLTLDAGTHLLEIREAGFDPLSLRVRIDGGRTITYRGTLQAMSLAAPEPPVRAAAPAAAPPPIPRKPFYFIPGCYLGDVPPKDAKLPASCDQSRAVMVWP